MPSSPCNAPICSTFLATTRAPRTLKRVGRLLVTLSLLLPALSGAQAPTTRSIDGMGRVTIGGGLRWVPNDYFAGKAAEAGFALLPKPIFSPQGTASFGYGANEFIEVAIDVLIGYEQFRLANAEKPYGSLTYGGLLGARLTKADFLFRGLFPYIGGQFGAILSTLTTSSGASVEKLLNGYAVNAGVTYLFADRFGLSLDIRYLWARAYLEPISGINVGGLFLTLGFTVVFPSSGNQRFSDVHL
jgi:hypothetical protein